MHLQCVLPCTPDTQGDALGYEQVGLTDRSLSEWVYFYVVAKKEQKKHTKAWKYEEKCVILQNKSKKEVSEAVNRSSSFKQSMA